MRKTNYALALALLIIATYTSEALAEDTFIHALASGTPYLDARYRYEFVDQEGIPHNAHASTLRTRLGYRSGSLYGFSGTLEFENISHIGSDNYHDTLNGRSDHPVVADVESTELNQVFLRYEGIADTAITVGRQAIDLDAQRFIGSVGWRQNNQTMDAIYAQNQSLDDTVLTYGYLDKIHRIFGDDSPVGNWQSDSHIINVKTDAIAVIGTVTAYGYILDFKHDAPVLSSATYGASLKGQQPLNEDIALKYLAEYAYQQDHGDNPTQYDTYYAHIAPAISYGAFTTMLGYEVLGSDGGNIGFSTPLATLHKFNGWADKFLSTPANGLEDRYIDLTYKLSGLEGSAAIFNRLLLKAQYHEFSADEGGAEYGTEFDVYAKQPVDENYYIEMKYADYHADTFATDAQRLTFGMGVTF